MDIWWGTVLENTVGQDKDLGKDPLPDWEPVELDQDGGSVLMFSSADNEMSSGTQLANMTNSMKAEEGRFAGGRDMWVKGWVSSKMTPRFLAVWGEWHYNQW